MCAGVLEQHFTRSLEEFGRAHREREVSLPPNISLFHMSCLSRDTSHPILWGMAGADGCVLQSEDDQSLPEWAEQLMGPKYLERLQTVSKALELLALEVRSRSEPFFHVFGGT